MATDLALRNTQNASPNVDLGVIGTTVVYDMLVTFGASSDTAVVDTAASGTEILFTKTAGGNSMCFISGRVPAGGFTLTSTFLSAWFHESNMNANCGGRYRVFKYTPGAPATLTEIGGGPFNDGVEFGTSATEMTWTGNVTDTALAENDRIVVKIYITNVGTMASGHTCTLTFNAASASTGDSFFQIAENITFKAENQAISGAGNIATGEAFGTLAVNLTVFGAGNIATAEAFGSDSVNLTLPTVGGIASAEAFGTLLVNLNVSGAGAIASEEAFGGHTITNPGSGQTVSPSAIGSDEAFGSGQVNLTLVNVGGLASAEAFGSHTVLPGAVTLSPAGIGSDEAFGADQINLGLSGAGAIVSGEAFGAAQANLTLLNAGAIASAEAFGVGTLHLAITGAGNIVSGEAFGASIVTPGVVTVSPTGIGSDEAFGLLGVFATIPLPESIGIVVIVSGEARAVVVQSGEARPAVVQEAAAVGEFGIVGDLNVRIGT